MREDPGELAKARFYLRFIDLFPLIEKLTNGPISELDTRQAMREDGQT